LETYGLLFTPEGSGPFPLVISQHGGGGTPELCSNLFQPGNYNDMSRRVLRRGCLIFAPQLPMWREEFGPPSDRPRLDLKLKHLGGSGVALDVFQLQRCLEVLAARSEVDAERIGMMGLSWGGFYTLAAAAVDTRIKAALASAFLNTAETAADVTPQVWFGAADTFHLAEIAMLICPRPLYIEIGVKDEHVVVAGAAEEAASIRETYDCLGIGERFVYDEHPGGHEFGREDDGIAFLLRGMDEAGCPPPVDR
jgi:dienelactone hydrolase